MHDEKKKVSFVMRDLNVTALEDRICVLGGVSKSVIHQ